MSEREKALAESIAEAVKVLPAEKKEYLLGYAEGVAAMAARSSADAQQAEEQSA